MPPTAELTVEELSQRLARGDRFFLLDVRNRDDFAASRIEGREPLPSLNVPYFDILEAGGKDDVGESVVAWLDGPVAPRLPAKEPIVVVCAKGQTSALVAQGLTRRGLAAATLRGGMAAWGGYYSVQRVVDEGALTILQIVRPARGCVSHVIESGGHAVVIDPLRHVEPVLALARTNAWTIDLVLDTHGHADHVSAGPALARQLGVPYHLHPYDAVHPIDVLPARIPIEFLRDGQEIAVGASTVRVLHVPGHTLGNVALLVDDRYLLSGDSIFLRSISRPDLGGRGAAWAKLHHQSLRRLLQLPDATLVLPGHFSAPAEANAEGLFAARLGDLRRENEGLRMAMESEEEFVRYVLSNVSELPQRYVEMKRVNLGLARPDEESTAELETGRNVCALGGIRQSPPSKGDRP